MAGFEVTAEATPQVKSSLPPAAGFELNHWGVSQSYTSTNNRPLDGLWTTLQRVDIGYSDSFTPDYYTAWPGGGILSLEFGCPQVTFPPSGCTMPGCPTGTVGWYADLPVRYHPSLACSVGLMLE